MNVLIEIFRWIAVALAFIVVDASFEVKTGISLLSWIF